MELEVLRYTNRISSEAHREVSRARLLERCLVGLGELHCSVWGQRAASRWTVSGQLQSRVPVEQQKMLVQPVSFLFPSGDRAGTAEVKAPTPQNLPARSPHVLGAEAFPPGIPKGPAPFKESFVLSGSKHT